MWWLSSLTATRWIQTGIPYLVFTWLSFEILTAFPRHLLSPLGSLGEKYNTNFTFWFSYSAKLNATNGRLSETTVKDEYVVDAVWEITFWSEFYSIWNHLQYKHAGAGEGVRFVSIQHCNYILYMLLSFPLPSLQT